MPTHAFLPPAGQDPKWLSHMQSSLVASNTETFMVPVVEIRRLRQFAYRRGHSRYGKQGSASCHLECELVYLTLSSTACTYNLLYVISLIN